MFKLESYITPILLSYVDKYIKNFKPEDSQLSLWGGEVSFHNLDLRLEVLEEELQLPFSFVSGHIHELVIHVPWTKLTSEPICITINTIECILKLRGEDSGAPESSGGEARRRVNKSTDVVAPPGYVQTRINKIVSNITINCCNLIVKYVEEDIVMSMNVKNLTFQSANSQWQPEFSDLSSELMLRKIISLSDVTVCLDKRNASGKIDSYQEPVLYRCSMTMRLLRCYNSPSAQRASISRLDVHCHKMAFNISEVQVPMMMRLLLLARALQSREVGQRVVRGDTDTHIDVDDGDENQEENMEQESWTGWAWNLVPAVLPVGWSEDWTEDGVENRGYTFHTGIYIDELAFNLRIGEGNMSDRSSWKSRLEPFLILSLHGCVLDTVGYGNTWFNAQLGICAIELEPAGHCSCGLMDTTSKPIYFSAGSFQEQYSSDSLFSPSAVENLGDKRSYNLSWELHQNTVTESSLLEKTPALAIDYLYTLELPDNFSPEKLQELNGDLEYSNLPENALCRVVMGPFLLRVNSGLLHRTNKFMQAALLYDYQPYGTPVPDDRREQLPTVTTEEYDSLEENIPLRQYQLTVFQPNVEFQLADHPESTALGRRKIPANHQEPASCNNAPVLSMSCQCIDARLISPMYPRRLVRTACLLPSLPQHMFHACHSHLLAKVLGLSCVMSLVAERQQSLFSVSDISFKRKELLLTHLWDSVELLHLEDSLDAEICVVTATKAQLTLAQRIIISLVGDSSAIEDTFSTTLVKDSFTQEGTVTVEVTGKNLVWQKVLTSLTRCDSLTVAAIEAFAMNSNSENKALVLSGLGTTLEPLFRACLQWPRKQCQQTHAPLLVVSVQETHVSLDPQFCVWLLYSPTTLRLSQHDRGIQSARGMQRKVSETSYGHTSAERTRRSQTPLSVHSSERDRDPPPQHATRLSTVSVEQPHLDTVQDEEWWLASWLVSWYSVWQGIVLSVDVAHWHISFPSTSTLITNISNGEVETQNSPDMVCVDLPALQLCSATPTHRQPHHLFPLPSKLPIHVPSTVWTEGGINFPWNMSLIDLRIWTVCGGQNHYLLRPVSTKCTIGISTRFSTSDKDHLTSLGLCIHNDTGPLHVNLNQAQAQLISSVVLGITAVSSVIFNNKNSQAPVVPVFPPSPTTISESASASEPHQLNKTSLPKVGGFVTVESVKLSVWLQWTLARMSVNLYHSKCYPADEKKQLIKLAFELEDLMTALDLHSVYSKIKLKVAGAKIHHYMRFPEDSDWQLAPYQGVVMCGYEEISPATSGQVPSDEGCGLLTATLTRAKCRNVHNRWGAPITIVSERETVRSFNSKDARFITEVLVKLQPLDFLLSMDTLIQWSSVLQPFSHLLVSNSHEGSGGFYTTANLPLLYLDFQAVRLLMPVATSHEGQHDTFIVQVESTALSPHTENPLWRTPIRPDLFHMAEQARILTVPGSEVEDRQYELNIVGLAVSTGQWQDMDHCRRLSASSAASSLRTMNENPALVWNSLGQNTQSDGPAGIVDPQPQLMSILAPLRICIVAAPAIMYRNKVLVCGQALEVNAVSNIEVTLTSRQLQLAATLISEAQGVWQCLISQSGVTKPHVPPYVALAQHQSQQRLLLMGGVDHSVLIDSGIDTGDVSSVETPQSSRPRGARRLSRTVRCLETVHGGSTSHSLRSRVCERDSISIPSRPSTDHNINILSTSRSSVIQKERLSTSPETMYSKDRHQDIPFDLLITGRRILLMLYEDVSKEGKKMCKGEGNKEGKSHSAVPLLYVLVTQPHAFISHMNRTFSIQASVYDTLVKLGYPPENCNNVPCLSDSDFPLSLIESCKGDPPPRTGVPPALCTLNWTCACSKPAQVTVELDRPVKLTYSMVNVLCIDHISSVINTSVEQLMRGSPPTPEPSLHPNSSVAERMREVLAGISSINVKTSQLVIAVQAENEEHIESAAEFSIASISGELSCMSRTRWGSSVATIERVACSLSCSGLALSTSYSHIKRLLLQPCVVELQLELLWPAWLPKNLSSTLPHTQLSVRSECVSVDISPDHARSLSHLLSVYMPIMHTESSEPLLRVPLSTPASEACSSETGTESVDTEQHYTDDLRAGAFQFMDATDTMERDQLPLPYQCVFWETSPPAIAWRYPQPRTLTNVQIFPVPFKGSPEAEIGKEEAPVVVCSLQYWSECRGAYQPYATFLLSETSGSHLDLPTTPGPAVSAAWRVLLAGTQDLHEPVSNNYVESSSLEADTPLVSPRALAACMRVDSYFSASLAPGFQTSFNITLIQVSLVNQLSDSLSRSMPHPLQDYTLDGSMPDTHSFLWISLNHATVFWSMWPEGSKMMEFSGLVRCNVLDYTSLTQQNMVEPFLSHAYICLKSDGSVDISLVTRCITVRVGPSIAHTLAVSSQLWQQEWLMKDTTSPQVLVTQYILCNDTILPLRFGQVNTDEDFPLPSRQCHMYSWQSLAKSPLLHVSLVDPSISNVGKRIWSSSFSIDICGTQSFKLHVGQNRNIILFVKVSSLSATQKMVNVSGQLIILNQLNEALDLRVMRPPSDWSVDICGCVVSLQQQRVSPSMILDRPTNDPQLALRLRQRDTNLWTGDIPLRENPKSQEPWLVKVPLQEKGQFISIWCRVIRQTVDGHMKILVLLSPLYALRSFLPSPMHVLLSHCEDAEKNFTVELKGKGTINLLHCPGGLIEHTYELKMHEVMSNATVPLGYAYADHRQLFQTPEQQDIDSILESLNEKNKVTWPLPDPELQIIEWIGIAHPNPLMKVSYGSLSSYSGTLLLELRPWAILMNLLGSPVRLEQTSNIVVSLPSRGVVALPKLEGTFQFSLQNMDSGVWHPSEALQLTRADWGKSFYMPRISGLIPIEGHICITVNSGPMVSLLTLASQTHDDMRVVSVRPSFIVNNSSSQPLQITAFAVRHVDMNRRLNVPMSSSPEAILATFTAPPDSNNKGYPIQNWLLLKSCDADVVPYLSFSTTENGPLSCPMRLTGCLARRRFTVPLSEPVCSGKHLTNLTTRSLVMCVMETNGQTFINIADEPHPQIILHNLCNFRILCAQGCPISRGNPSECKALADAAPWEWVCGVDPDCETEYNLMAIEESFPQLPPSAPSPSLLLAVDTTATTTVMWSAGIQLTGSQEQFISLPGHGDVKVRIWTQCYTTHVCIEAVSRVEICARDIRSRLSAAPGIPFSGILDNGMPVSALEVVVPSPVIETQEAKSSMKGSKDDPLSLQDRGTHHISISAFLHSFSLSMTSSVSPTDEIEVAALTMDHVGVIVQPISPHPMQSQGMEISLQITVGDFQLDNHLFMHGGYDFPVVLMGQHDDAHKPVQRTAFSLNSCATQLIEKLSPEALLALKITLESSPAGYVPKTVHLSVGPLTAYVEDTFVLQLSKHIASLLSPTLTLWESSRIPVVPSAIQSRVAWVPVPLAVCWEWQVLERPLRLTSLSVDPVWLLLSVHSSMRLYIALDRSPLQFTQFSRRSVFTTAYNLGHSLTMHYLSGAIFGAGWVVGSWELLGSPGGFARTLGTGLRDFVSLPYRGILQGPWGFLVGVTHGSASLMKHFTAGTLNSVTKMASSVARNLDRLTLDAEHLQRTEEMRRVRPQGVTEGLLHGLTGLGISLLGAVGGLAHHPLQSVLSGSPSPRDVVTGVGRGLVGVITKPLSGAADLVAMTGQGLLQGAGWSNMPQLRQQSRTEQTIGRSSAPLKYSCKVQRSSVPPCLLLLQATQELIGGKYQAVTLVLTTKSLIVLNSNDELVESHLPLTELGPLIMETDPIILTVTFKAPPPQVDHRIWDFINGCQNVMNPAPPALENTEDSRPATPPLLSTSLPLSLQTLEHQATPDVEDANPNLNLSHSSSDDGVSASAVPSSEAAEPATIRPPLVFHVNPQLRGHFLTLLKIAQRQLQGQGFPVL